MNLYRDVLASPANLISLGRFALLSPLLVVAVRSPSSSWILAVVVSGAVICSIALDAVDGAVARATGHDGPLGSQIDVLFDRLTSYGCILCISSIDRRFSALLLVLLVRDLIVDTAKVVAAIRGQDLSLGVVVEGRVRRWLVTSRASKGLYNASKAGWFAVVIGALVAPIDADGLIFLHVALAWIVLHAVFRGWSSVSSVIQLYGHEDERSPDPLTAGFVVQLLAGGVAIAWFVSTLT